MAEEQGSSPLGGAATGFALAGPVGALAGFGISLVTGGAAKRKLRRAKLLQGLNTQLANAQQKRQFITQARLARANIVAGASREGALDSSGTQGVLASLDTQTQNALTEQKIVAERNQKIERLVASAGTSQRQGQLASTAVNIGTNAVTEFTG